MQRPQRSPEGGGRDLANVHGHEAGGESCRKHTRRHRPGMAAPRSAETSPRTGREDGARVPQPASHSPPPALPACRGARRAVHVNTGSLAWSRDLLGAVITEQRALSRLSLTRQSAGLPLHASNSDSKLYF